MNYHTGCDAHSKYCKFQHMAEDGSLGLHMTVKTTKEDIHKFLDHLDAPTTMTLEAGRNYWWLSQLFMQHPIVSKVNVVDPRRSRQLAEELSVISGYGRAKNDRIDAEMLADQERRGLAPAIHVPTEEQLEKRTLTRYRSVMVVNRTRAKNFIHSLMAMHGFKAAIKTLLVDQAEKQEMMNLLPAYLQFMIKQLLDQIRFLDNHIPNCENKLNELLPPTHPQMKILMSAPGIAIVLARIISSEILDIHYFKEPKYLISYSGLAPIDKDSAGRKGPIQLNRHCNYWLKYAFVEAAHNAWDYPKYRRKYELDVKKHGKTIAKLNLARKLAKAVYWMLSRQQLYKS